MTKEELAAMLTGREYRDEINAAEEVFAKESGLVVVFGASDDLMEFRGAIYDEEGCSGGGSAYILDGALIDDDACPEHCKWFKAAFVHAVKIKAIWGLDWCWMYETEIPHATFQIFENGAKYCLGIVFDLADVKEPK